MCAREYRRTCVCVEGVWMYFPDWDWLTLIVWVSVCLPHLRCQFFHVGVNLVQDVKALLEESVLGTHEGQHLQETQGEPDGSTAPQELHVLRCKACRSVLRSQIQGAYQGLLTASRISNFFLAWRTLICEKQGGWGGAEESRTEAVYLRLRGSAHAMSCS